MAEGLPVLSYAENKGSNLSADHGRQDRPSLDVVGNTAWGVSPAPEAKLLSISPLQAVMIGAYAFHIRRKGGSTYTVTMELKTQLLATP
ncbi:hypothetical protein SAMN06265373_1168 [Shimia sagamensis]|uniref:Uncharacterized protein n=1 Tax=Shimia sagamensis TaxID=1566352 RepID=A0ABY1PLW0_9RHOB|nr:hypothetical protein SAMN06265373_1168 [Shimia sagamensis]